MLKTWVFNNIHIFSNKAYLPSKQPIFVENLLFVENYVERLLKSLKNRWKNGKICGSSFLNYSFHWFLIFEFNIWYLIFDYGYFCYAFLMAKNKFAINRTGFKNFFFQWRIYKSFAHIFRDTVQFSCCLRKFYDIFLIFLQKVLTKRKISAIIPGVGTNILANQRAALCGKRRKSGFL